MRTVIFLISYFVFFTFSNAQEDFLAKQYFNDGDYGKAVVFYEKLVAQNQIRTDYAEALVACYQQLERYADAEAFLVKLLAAKNAPPTYFIELGYNHALQKADEKAVPFYQKALLAIERNAALGYTIGSHFQKYALLDYAITAYTLAMQLNPSVDYNYQLARVYGEQGDIDKMFRAYLKLILEEKASMSQVVRNFDDFVTDDAENENNLKLKSVLIEGSQKDPNLRWNELLSWLFVKQKQYSNAFRQEKAIFKRLDGSSVGRIEALAEIALGDGHTQEAQEMFEYIDANTFDGITKLNARLKLIDIQLLAADEGVISAVDKQFEDLMAQYGFQGQTLQLQVAYANFLTFKKDMPGQGITILKTSLELPLNERGYAFIKMALGEILVYGQKFNEALIYFSQVQKSLKNDVLGQDARFKVAQTSFYKGDFDWALTQLKVLRNSTSQLIANDAMQLSLLISDNSLEDSTRTALKKYARADLLAYQNKPKEAIAELDGILTMHKGEKIEDEALLKQGQLFESLADFEAAKYNYIKITEFYGNDILADDAHFALGELYRKIYNDPAKAKIHYEKIIYAFQDSYYFPQARKFFRQLRGDAIN